MSTVVRSPVDPPAEGEAPVLPTGEIVVPPPPATVEPDGAGGVLTAAIPLVGGLGSVALVAATVGAGPGGQARSLVAAGVLVVVTLTVLVLQLDRQRRRRTSAAAATRTSYLRQLGGVRRAALAAAAQQRAALRWRHPDPATTLVSRGRARAPAQEAALEVRWAVGDRPLAVDLVAPDPGLVDQADPAAAAALRRFLVVHAVQPDLPLTVDLLAHRRLEPAGPLPSARALARALVCSAAAAHPPDCLAVAVLADDRSAPDWEWVKWLPHALSPRAVDGVGPRRMVCTSPADLAGLLPAERHVLLVVDRRASPPDEVVPRAGEPGVTVVALPGHARADPDALLLPAVDPATTGDPVPDRCDRATAEAVARRLAGAESRPGAGTAGAPGCPVELPALLGLPGLDDVRRHDPVATWLTARSRSAADRLRVPIGVDDDGRPVHLDLKESAEGGVGPHGLLVGATGSGKSELLRTLVLGLALTHDPDRLNLVLVDFKGGATFAGLADLPHASAVITNLADDHALVDRMGDVLVGELQRRQQVLRDAGGHASVRDYDRARTSGADLPALPPLLVVVDEFAELLAARPELLEVVTAIGRLGRSLGLHLLLASQRLDEGRLRGLESHLSYRIALRTFSAADSRAVLGIADAHRLPSEPGLGLLLAGHDEPVRFRSAYVSGPAAEPVPAPRHRERTWEVLPWTAAEVTGHASSAEEAPTASADDRASLLTVAVERLRGSAPPAHRIWVPPLETPDTLDALMPDLAPDAELGLVSHEWRSRGRLTVPIGSVDRPREQRRDTLTVDLSGAGGHVAVVGGPRSGTSTLLRTLVAAVALTSSPAECCFYVLDLGGGAFEALRPLPHVAGLAARSEPDVVRRIVAEVRRLVDQREARFRELGIDSIETYRLRRAEPGVDDAHGEVFLVVDGWGSLRPDLDELEHALQQLAARGLAYGVHLVAASARWADFRAATRDLFGTRLELRLGDPVDSEVDRRAAALVPTGRPGRGLVPGPWHVLTALPRIDGDAHGDTLGEGIADLVARVAAAWRGPPGPTLRLLPSLVTRAELLGRTGARLRAGGQLLLGLDERELAPVGLDPDADPHWLVYGDGASGKTAALRAYLHEVVRTRTPEHARLLVVDYRRSLLGEVPPAWLLAYPTSPDDAATTLADLARRLEQRLPVPHVTAEQLRARSWWTGAEVFVVVDDYDLVAGTHGSPLQVLQPLLARARDVGLHLVVARRTGGAARALYEPVLQTLRDLGSAGLVLSGNPDEGPLVGGVRPVAAPPGRGTLVTRARGPEVVQLAWSEPS